MGHLGGTTNQEVAVNSILHTTPQVGLVVQQVEATLHSLSHAFWYPKMVLHYSRKNKMKH
jgi:hypothetical protein